MSAELWQIGSLRHVSPILGTCQLLIEITAYLSHSEEKNTID